MLKKIFLLFLSLSLGCSKQNPPKEKKSPKVEAAEVVEVTIPIFLEAIGHVRAYNFAEIKSQVEGRLVAVHYEQGADVNAQDLLVTIDPRMYEAKVQEAEGIFLETKAQLRFAEEKVVRYSQLALDDYVSKINFDEYVTQREALLASLKKNEGVLKEAKINLDYCYIKAPFSGKIGKKLVDEGNLINNNGSTLLTIHQIQPIYVDFAISEKFLPEVMKNQKKGRLKVDICLSDNDSIEEVGEVIVIDNSVDKKTGMISLRAEFKNKKQQLWPGEFVKLRLIVEEKENALLVPQGALNLTQKGYFIYKIELDHTVTKLPVEVGQNLGGIYQVTGPLKKGDQVVTYGQFNISEDQAVEVVKLDKYYYPSSSKG